MQKIIYECEKFDTVCVPLTHGDVLMQTLKLRQKARCLFNNNLVPQSLNQYNQRKWVRSVLQLGDKWLLAKQIERIA